jgi:mono/diheme cytochrome c family protein
MGLTFVRAIALVIAAVSPGVAVEAFAEDSRGAYLAKAGNCKSCHTSASGPAYAGGSRFETPFGTIYSTNITPDPGTGIGSWTLQDFDRALREGMRPGGEHLYPVFPYTAFAKLKDSDVAALFDYLQALSPVKHLPPDNDLQFPYSQRWALGIWKLFYLDDSRFEPNPAQSSEWNRGAYLVEGLGHCGMCHTPRNFLGGQDNDSAFTGATYKGHVDDVWLNWSSTNLTSAASGLGSWSLQDIVSYLKLGISSRASIFGPMNEVVLSSTRHLTEVDLRSMAVYLKSLPANELPGAAPPSETAMRQGALQYDIHCGTCHLPTGLGSDSTGPPLVGSSVTLAPDPASLINITLHGPGYPPVAPSKEWQARGWQPMEPYNDILKARDTAALLTYVRNAWGNAASEVTVEQVEAQR